MHPRIQEVMSTLDAEFARLRDAVESVPAHRRAERPSARSTCISGCCSPQPTTPGHAAQIREVAAQFSETTSH